MQTHGLFWAFYGVILLLWSIPNRQSWVPANAGALLIIASCGALSLRGNPCNTEFAQDICFLVDLSVALFTIWVVFCFEDARPGGESPHLPPRKPP